MKTRTSLQAPPKLATVKPGLTLTPRPAPSPSPKTKPGILLWIRPRKLTHRLRKRQISPKVSTKQSPGSIHLPTSTWRTPSIPSRTTPLPRVKNSNINRFSRTRAHKLLRTVMHSRRSDRRGGCPRRCRSEWGQRDSVRFQRQETHFWEWRYDVVETQAVSLSCHPRAKGSLCGSIMYRLGHPCRTRSSEEKSTRYLGLLMF